MKILVKLVLLFLLIGGGYAYAVTLTSYSSECSSSKMKITASLGFFAWLYSGCTTQTLTGHVYKKDAKLTGLEDLQAGDGKGCTYTLDAGDSQLCVGANARFKVNKNCHLECDSDSSGSVSSNNENYCGSPECGADR